MSQSQAEYFRRYRAKNRERLKAKDREYYLNNKEKINERNKAYYQENRQSILQKQREYVDQRREQTSENQKAWRKRNSPHIQKYRKKYYRDNRKEIIAKSVDYQRTCPKAKAAKAIRRRLNAVLKSKGQHTGTRDLLGCSFEEFRDYIEAQFIGCMNWENYGRAWHIDHIIPCAAFDLTDPDQIKQCFHFANLRPLWRKTNLRKNKYMVDPQLRLLL